MAYYECRICEFLGLLGTILSFKVYQSGGLLLFVFKLPDFGQLYVAY